MPTPRSIPLPADLLRSLVPLPALYCAPSPLSPASCSSYTHATHLCDPLPPGPLVNPIPFTAESQVFHFLDKNKDESIMML